MKKFRRILAALLSALLLLQPIAFAASVTDFSDFPTGWSKEAMTAAVDNGLMIGKADGRIHPEDNLTRAELAAFVTRAFGATLMSDISAFTDVTAADWFYESVAKAVKMGAMTGKSDTTFEPESEITREEVFVAIARVLCITGTDASVLAQFSDNAAISDWAANAIIGLVSRGYIHGYEDGTIRPKNNITREELAQIFHNIFKLYISDPGYYTSVPAGSVMVRAKDVHLESVGVNGDVVIADGVGIGDFYITSVSVNGRVLARGGEGKVTFKSTTVSNGIVVYDNNGTVNFNNYADEAPFGTTTNPKANVTEYTPATYLKRPTVTPGYSGGGGGGGGHATTYYDVVFHNVDGSTSTKRVARNNKVAIPAEPEQDGYTFKGWSTDEEDYDPFDFNTLITKKTDLYAFFDVNVTFKYTDDPADDVVVPVEEGTPVEKPATDPTAPEGKHFKHWANEAGEEYDFNTPVNDPTVLHPVFEADTFTVKFTVDGVDYGTAQTVEYGKFATKPADPAAPAGKEFAGWTIDDAIVDVETYEIKADTTFVAKFVDETVTKFTVTFLKDDGTTLTEVEVPEGDTVAAATALIVVGKTFKHWSETAGGEAFDFTTPIAADKTLYPVYETNKYTVTFYDEDGVTEISKTENVEHGTTVTAATAPDKEFKTFKHWAEEKDGAEAFDFSTAITADKSLYAVYETNKYTVTFYDEDGTTEIDKTENVEHGTTVTAATAPDKTGKTFKHWAEEKDGATAFDFTTPIVGDKSLYAVYEATATETFTVTFVVNGTTVSTQDVEKDDFATEPDADTINAAVPSGKKFAKWQVNGADVDVATYAITENTEFVAVLEDESDVIFYFVTFFNEDGSAVVDTQTVSEGDLATPAAAPEVTGKTFKHWSETKGGTEAFDFTTPINAGKSLYAVYEIDDVVFYVVTFYAEDGTTVVDTQTVNEGETVTPATAPDVTGKTFKHWSETRGGEEAFDFTTPINAGKSLYAVYEETADTVTVRFWDLENDLDEPIAEFEMDKGEAIVTNHADDIPELPSREYRGYQKNPTISSVYAGENFTHKVDGAWFVPNADKTDWEAFDENAVVNEDLDVYFNVKELGVEIKVAELGNKPFPFYAWYNDDVRAADSAKDLGFTNENAVVNHLNAQAMPFIFGKLAEKNLVTEYGEIKNILKDVYFVDVVGKNFIETQIRNFVGGQVPAGHESDPEVIERQAKIQQLIDELCNKEDVTITDDRLFMFDPIIARAESKLTFDKVWDKIDPKVAELLPRDAVKDVYERHYNAYMTAFRDAYDNAAANPGTVYSIPSFISVAINPVDDLLVPALDSIVTAENAYLAVIADSPYADLIPYYRANPYVAAIKDLAKLENLVDGESNGYFEEMSGYSVKDAQAYYDLIQSAVVLADDAMLWNYNNANIPEELREKAFEALTTRVVAGHNMVNGFLDLYAGGVPATLTELVSDMEKDPELNAYLHKFGLVAYLDKVAANKYAQQGYEGLADKFGDRIASLIERVYANTVFNRDHTEEELTKLVEDFFNPASDYTVDNVFADYFEDGNEWVYDLHGKATITITRGYLVDITLAK